MNTLPNAQRLSAPDEPRALATTLAILRLCAVAGQSLTVLGVTWVLAMDVPLAPLAAGIAALAAFGLFSLWRVRQPWPLRAGEVVAHIGVDTAVLGWLLYWTGGAANPFVSLLLMPTTLAASALALRHVAVVAELPKTPAGKVHRKVLRERERAAAADAQVAA